MSSKTTLYALVGELHGWGFSPTQVGAILGYTPQRIRQIIADLKAPTPTIDDLPAPLRQRIRDFLNENERQARLTGNA